MFMTADGRGEFPPYPHEDRDSDGVLKHLWTSRFDSIDTVFLGRKAYVLWEPYWPAQKENPSSSPFQVAFSRFMDRVDKVVFSKTLKEVHWDKARIRRGGLAQEVRRLKALPGKNLTIGGGPQLARAFMNEGLIDDYLLVVAPVLLGAGKRMFGDTIKRQTLKLVEVERFPSGTLFLHYQRVATDRRKKSDLPQ